MEDIMESFDQQGGGTADAMGMDGMTPAWAANAVFYHIYPLGLLGASFRNPAPGAAMEPWQGPQPLDRLIPWADHLAGMGFTAVYLGPLFESSSHGYDTVDYFRVDRRLGDNAGLRRLVEAFHAQGIRVVLDAVLNHVGRDFPAFRDLQSRGRDSAGKDWFAMLDFSRRGPAGDDFAYEGWHGHYDLVKLDLERGPARRHLLDAVAHWVREFGIDGLRLDAADCLDFGFMQDLAAHCRVLKDGFWLMGEVVHGDYRRWAGPGHLHSVTNYEAYKGLWSSLNDKNFFEIDWTLKRQSGPVGADLGLYRDRILYNFADNHDVDRVASVLKDPAQLELLYSLLFAMPGIPSVYYGSEWGIGGRRRPGTDEDLRPALSLEAMCAHEQAGRSQSPRLCGHISHLIRVRREHPALVEGRYRPAHVAAEQLAFWRDLEGR
jgi:glycosidase